MGRHRERDRVKERKKEAVSQWERERSQEPRFRAELMRASPPLSLSENFPSNKSDAIIRVPIICLRTYYANNNNNNIVETAAERLSRHF